MAPILRVTVSSLINQARTRTRTRSSSTTTPVIFSSACNDFSYPPSPPSFGPINLEKFNSSNTPNLNNFIIPVTTEISNQKTSHKQDYPPPATRLYAVQGCYTYRDQQLQQKKKMYPYSDQQQKSLSHDQHMVIHVVVHAVIRTTIGTFLIGCAIRSQHGVLY